MRVRYDVVPSRPYSLARTAARLARYAERVDRFENGVYRRLLFIERHPLLMEVVQEGPPSKAVLRVTLTGARCRTAGARRVAGTVLERVLGTSQSVRAFYRAFRNDPLLGPLVVKHRGLRVAGRLSVWDTLVQIVLSQQINLKFAHDLLSELVTTFGASARFDGERFYAFPTTRRFARLTVPELRGHRLSGSKASTLVRLAKAFESNDLSDERVRAMDDDDAVAFLMSFKGVGRWTAEFTLLRGVSRPDVFPAGDLGVVKYLPQKMLGRTAVSTEDEMRRFASRWRPYRGLALMYLYAELA